MHGALQTPRVDLNAPCTLSGGQTCSHWLFQSSVIAQNSKNKATSCYFHLRFPCVTCRLERDATGLGIVTPTLLIAHNFKMDISCTHGHWKSTRPQLTSPVGRHADDLGKFLCKYKKPFQVPPKQMARSVGQCLKVSDGFALVKDHDFYFGRLFLSGNTSSTRRGTFVGVLQA